MFLPLQTRLQLGSIQSNQLEQVRLVHPFNHFVFASVKVALSLAGRRVELKLMAQERGAGLMVKFLAQSRLQEFYLAPSEGQEEWVGGCGRGGRGPQKSKDNNNSKDNGNNEDNNEDNNDDDDDYKALRMTPDEACTV